MQTEPEDGKHPPLELKTCFYFAGIVTLFLMLAAQVFIHAPSQTPSLHDPFQAESVLGLISLPVWFILAVCTGLIIPLTMLTLFIQ